MRMTEAEDVRKNIQRIRIRLYAVLCLFVIITLLALWYFGIVHKHKWLLASVCAVTAVKIEFTLRRMKIRWTEQVIAKRR
jgi:Na+-translocating ferredoxin:NAD+ oxidoreductase RnfD subunit